MLFRSFVILASVFLILEGECHVVARLAECRVVVGDDLVRRVAKDYSLDGDDWGSPGCGGAGALAGAHAGKEEPHDFEFAGDTSSKMGVARFGQFGSGATNCTFPASAWG